jgi:WD40 repeat protein
VRAVAFSPDGKRLATACWDGRVRIWNLATRTEVVACAPQSGRLLSVVFAPDGKHLLAAGSEEGVKLWDAGTGADKRTWKHGNAYIPWAVFSPDGRWVLTAGYDGTTRLWDVAGGPPRAVFSGTAGVHRLAYSPAARTLAVCGYGREVSLFNLTFRAPQGKELEHIRALMARWQDDSYEVREAASKELLEIGFVAEAELQRAAKEAKSAEVRIRARRLRQALLSQPSQPCATLRGHTAEIESAAFTPEGRLLASGSRDGTVRLWELPSGKEAARLVPGR